jgi:hypothetical protein
MLHLNSQAFQEKFKKTWEDIKFTRAKLNEFCVYGIQSIKSIIGVVLIFYYLTTCDFRILENPQNFYLVQMGDISTLS